MQLIPSPLQVIQRTRGSLAHRIVTSFEPPELTAYGYCGRRICTLITSGLLAGQAAINKQPGLRQEFEIIGLQWDGPKYWTIEQRTPIGAERPRLSSTPYLVLCPGKAMGGLRKAEDSGLELDYRQPRECDTRYRDSDSDNKSAG